MRRHLVNMLGIVVLAVAGLVYTFAVGNKPLLGLDLQGGASVVLEPTSPATDEALDQAVEIIRNRVDGLGVAEPEITRQGNDILVQLPGVDDQNRALELVGQTAELRFRPVLDEISESTYQAAVSLVENPPSTTTTATTTTTGEGDTGDQAPSEADQLAAQIEAARQLVERFRLSEDPAAGDQAVLPQYDDQRNVVSRLLVGPTVLTGDGLQTAAARFQVSTGWYVAPTFHGGSPGIDDFNRLAAACFNADATCPTGRIAIDVDDEVISAPQVNAAAFERDAITITGSFTEEEAKDLALALRFGALPVELAAQESRVVSATLGQDALNAGVIAGLIGLALVAVYLFAYYRLMGAIAIVSLMISGALLWTIVAWLGETRGLALTLAGVTGLIVSIGVSVDSNVVYFESLKEEVRNGRSLRAAVDRSFPAAFSTIVKADLASLIAALVLYFLTVGQVKGFALYLGLATVLDLVATYFFMGPAVRLLAARPGMKEHPGRFGIIAPSGDAEPAPAPAT
ncbi:MAG: protein translocase subunit SecD [Actinomyces sp.]|nr:MAG: protein translocase subunit SecD [Actinomyces sp.]